MRATDVAVIGTATKMQGDFDDFQQPTQVMNKDDIDMLAPIAQEKLEFVDYLTNTHSLEIIGAVTIEKEIKMYPSAKDGGDWAYSKYLKVRAVKKTSTNQSQSMCKKKIKLGLVDHEKYQGIPYEN